MASINRMQRSPDATTGNLSAANETSSECEEIEENLKELDETAKSCDADPTCWPALKKQLDLVKGIM